jgi:hypothetical protein
MGCRNVYTMPSVSRRETFLVGLYPTIAEHVFRLYSGSHREAYAIYKSLKIGQWLNDAISILLNTSVS